MISLGARIVRLIIRMLTYRRRKEHKSLSRTVKFKSGRYVPPKSVSCRTEYFNGIRTEIFTPKDAEKFAVIFFHGGGHTVGMNDMYRKVAQRYAKLCRCTVLCIDYKPGTELKFPSVHNECFSAYLGMTKELKMPFAVAGDSFGANLMLYCTIKAREEGANMPQAIVCISPYADMSASGQSYKTNCRNDPIYSLTRWQSFEENEKYIRRISPYCNGTPLKDSYLSPVYAKLNGLSDMLIIYGSYETSASDGEILQKNAVGNGVNVRLVAYEGMWHDFVYMTPFLKESRRAWRQISEFISAHF